MYKCKYFKIYELVPPGIYRLRGEKAWELMDRMALRTIDVLREKYGSCTINDWYWGGKFKYSGFRPKSCTEGSGLSQHRLGRAFDLKFKEVDAETVRQEIINNHIAYINITSMELGVSWVHLDTRNYDISEGMLLFKP